MSEVEVKQTVLRLIDQFLGSYQGIDELELQLGGLDINDNELKEVIGNYDSSNSKVYNNEVIDEYTYDVHIYKADPEYCTKYMKKLVLAYRIKDENGNRNYILYYVHGFYDKVHVKCNEP